MSTPSSKRLLGIIQQFKKAKVLVVGDLMLDEYIRGKVQRISPEAPVPVVEVTGNSSFMPGGALNVAHNIHSLGGTVFPCGLIGRDLYGRMLSRKIREYHIEMGGIVTASDRPTTLKTRVVAHSQQVVRFDRESRDIGTGWSESGGQFEISGGSIVGQISRAAGGQKNLV